MGQAGPGSGQAGDRGVLLDPLWFVVIEDPHPTPFRRPPLPASRSGTVRDRVIPFPHRPLGDAGSLPFTIRLRLGPISSEAGRRNGGKKTGPSSAGGLLLPRSPSGGLTGLCGLPVPITFNRPCCLCLAREVLHPESGCAMVDALGRGNGAPAKGLWVDPLRCGGPPVSGSRSRPRSLCPTRELMVAFCTGYFAFPHLRAVLVPEADALGTGSPTVYEKHRADERSGGPRPCVAQTHCAPPARTEIGVDRTQNGSYP